MKYSISEHLKLICPNSIIQEIHSPNYEIELDFSNNINEQTIFMNRGEKEITAGEICTFIFNNKIFPSANMVSISHKNNELEYQTSVVFSRERWKEIKPLDKFIPDLIQHCRAQGLKLKLEAVDEYFYYLLLTQSVMAETTIADRVNYISLRLVDKISELL